MRAGLAEHLAQQVGGAVRDGRLLAELQFSTADEILAHGLHAYIDEIQTKLNTVGEAMFQTYIFQHFSPQQEDEIRQQEEQQQQQRNTRPELRR